jgi:hypothetical protein
MRPGSLAVALLISITVASAAGAQGALSLLGLGYPPGGFSARAEGTGGGMADFDPMSATSPASLAGVGATAVFFQYSPEWRKVTVPNGEAKTTTARFPVLVGVLPMGPNWTLGLGSTTFLDRSQETSLTRSQVVGTTNDTVTLVERNKVLGAINDVRLALAYSSNQVVRVGVGAHVFAGSNRITFSQLFPDTAIFIGTTQNERISYAGFAFSGGIEIHPLHTLAFAISGRKGGELRAESGNSLIGKGHIPDHFSGSIAFEGFPGASITARVSHDSWSSLQSLSSSGVRALDGWDSGFGIEASGPRLLQRVIALRAGARFRTLPFAYNGEKVSETTVAAGLGVPLSRDRAALDFSVQHANRTAADIKERGFILSFGLRVTP